MKQYSETVAREKSSSSRIAMSEQNTPLVMAKPLKPLADGSFAEFMNSFSHQRSDSLGARPITDLKIRSTSKSGRNIQTLLNRNKDIHPPAYKGYSFKLKRLTPRQESISQDESSFLEYVEPLFVKRKEIQDKENLPPTSIL